MLLHVQNITYDKVQSIKTKLHHHFNLNNIIHFKRQFKQQVIHE